MYLEGGPGGSAIDGLDADPESWEYPFLEGRELVLLDQRGTGYSQPTLDCPEITDDALPGEAERACFERLTAEGIDIGAYTTAESAADVATLRTVLGVSEWDLLGISYGTRLALEVMRSYPEGVRSAVLDSPFPPNVDLPVAETFVVLEAFEQLLADCEAEDYCSENYPDLAGTFLDTVAALNADPVDITGDDLVLGLYNAFQDPGSIPLIPWVIYEVASGNTGALDEIAGGEGFRRFQAADDVSDSEGMYFSVMCHDEYAVGDFERAEVAAVGTVPPELESALLQGTFEVTSTCSYWNPREAVDDSPVVSDIPALVLVGAYDTATPPSWAALTAETLANAFLYSFPGLGHYVLGDPCPVEIAGQFLADPHAEPDASCIDAIEWPYFE
jgi:pimeloyl-ACP methyl ester carboxylesterase